MGKKQKICGLIFLIICFCGCQKRESTHSNLVTSIEVTCHHNGRVLVRNYQKPDKISAILNYLRSQIYRGRATVDPERLPGDKFLLILRYSDGHTAKIIQRANGYLSRNYHRWEKIDSKRASRLYPLLLAIPEDLPVNQT